MTIYRADMLRLWYTCILMTYGGRFQLAEALAMNNRLAFGYFDIGR